MLNWWTADRVEAAGTWVAAVGTVGTLIVASIGLERERRARRKDVSDVTQALAQIERERSAQYGTYLKGATGTTKEPHIER